MGFTWTNTLLPTLLSSCSPPSLLPPSPFKMSSHLCCVQLTPDSFPYCNNIFLTKLCPYHFNQCLTLFIFDMVNQKKIKKHQGGSKSLFQATRRELNVQCVGWAAAVWGPSGRKADVGTTHSQEMIWQLRLNVKGRGNESLLSFFLVCFCFF